MTHVAVKKVCQCGAEFSTTNDSDKCYACTLESVTGGLPPEEGDFNTASITSGTMTRQERAWLQQDLESVEVQDPYEDEEGWYDDEGDIWEDYYPEYCPDCGAPADHCSC